MFGNMNEEQIEDVLLTNSLGRIGCHDGERVYVVPVNYVYNEKYILAHSVQGMKIRIMRKNPKVCFQVDEVQNFTNWKSVILWGTYQELTDEKERYNAMKIFVERMLKLKISSASPSPEAEISRFHPRQAGSVKPVIYRIIIEERTGRYEKE